MSASAKPPSPDGPGNIDTGTAGLAGTERQALPNTILRYNAKGHGPA